MIACVNDQGKLIVVISPADITRLKTGEHLTLPGGMAGIFYTPDEKILFNKIHHNDLKATGNQVLEFLKETLEEPESQDALTMEDFKPLMDKQNAQMPKSLMDHLKENKL